MRYALAMPQVAIHLPHHRYEVVIAPGLLARLGPCVREVAPHGRAALLHDAALPPRHAHQAARSLADAGYSVTEGAFATSERLKSLDTVRAMYELLLRDRLERRSPIVALGGGILTDTAGFAAASYLRGVPLVMAPTTLLAMVDASVGGKVGVNVPQGKNLIGAFYQPALVAVDTDALATLPPRELRCGLAECIKHAMIRDPQLMQWLEANLDAVLALDSSALVDLVRWNVSIKAKVVMADEKEAGERAHLNFGHTFAHAIEATQGEGAAEPPADTEAGKDPSGGGCGGYHHGEAVALGMVAATRLAVERGLADAFVLERLMNLLTRADLPVAAPSLPPVDALMNAMAMDKKVADARIRLILPRAVGQVAVHDDIPHPSIERAWAAMSG